MKIIVTGHQEGQSNIQNSMDNWNLGKTLNRMGLLWEQVIGTYEGRTEIGYLARPLIDQSYDHVINMAQHLADSYQQECAYVEYAGSVLFVYASGHVTHMGEEKRVTEKPDDGAYTDLLDGTFLIIIDPNLSNAN